jgi:NAD(P)-dependent dehydrogenase (short-subunit alcohol dehydrogenase family)
MSAGQQRLAGKIALVTGSTRGIGRTIAEWLALEGATIIVSGREDEAVEESVAAMRALGVESFGIPADVSDVADTHRLGAEAIRLAGRLDILVNNAGMSTRGNFWEVSDADWEYQTNVNYRAPFILAQHAARDMIAKQTRGRIVNISTIGAHNCHLDAAVYDAAKGAVETMTRNMAYELGPYGIGVNCVAPGAIAQRPGAPHTPERWAQTAEYIPFGRVGQSEDIAAAVRFFCLPESAFTTGQVLLVDGAHTTWLPE